LLTEQKYMPHTIGPTNVSAADESDPSHRKLHANYVRLGIFGKSGELIKQVD
jgi:hypothetical protein